MVNSNFDVKGGNCSNEFDDHIDAQSLDLHRPNDQSLGAVNIDVEKETPGLPRSPEPSKRRLRKRMADHMKDYAKNKKEINREFKRLKKASTYLENANVSFKNQCDRLEKSVKRHKKNAACWKGKFNGLTAVVAYLSTTLLLTEPSRNDQNEIQLLQQRIVQLEARNEQLENEINARD